MTENETGDMAVTVRRTFDEAAEFGAIEGAKQTVDHLAQHLSPGGVA